MKKQLLFIRPTWAGLFVILSAVGIIFSQSCQREDDSEGDSLDPVLLRSSELEEYIIAGADLQQSLNVFQAEFSKVDVSKLEFVENEKGEKVRHLPVTVEGKMRIFDDKKKSLFAKYPLFMSLTKSRKNDYFRTCVGRSVNVNSKLLELGININQLMTKEGTTENFGSQDELLSFLSEWVQSSDYVELVLIVFNDGRIMSYKDDSNTDTTFRITFATVISSGATRYYYPTVATQNQVAYMIHTHKYKNGSSDKDMANVPVGGLPTYLYYNGNIRQYDKNGWLN